MSSDEVDSTKHAGLPSWVPITVVVLLLVALARQAALPLSDPDIWWHLLLGSEFRSGRSLSDPGPFGAFSTEPWVPTQWLPEVLASIAVDAGGLPALAWIFGWSLLTLVVAIYSTCRTRASALPAAFATGAAIVGGSASLSPRPHMLTYIFLAITVGAWLRSSEDGAPRWWLIPLTWLWAACHGMWFLGPAIGLLAALGILLDRPVDSRDRRLLLVPLASVLAAALTPVGPRLLMAPFAVSGITQFVTEWAPADFRELGPAVTAAIIGIVTVAWARSRTIPWADVALLVSAAGLAALSTRTVTLSAVIMAPLLAGTIQGWLPAPRIVASRGELVAIASAASACLVVLALVVPSTASHPRGVPNALDAPLAELPQGTVVLNTDHLGGWLMREHPTTVPVVDGLFESYTSEYLGDYVNAMSAVPGWHSFVVETGATAALVEETRPIAGVLRDQLAWSVVGVNGGYVLLVADT